MTSEQEGTTGVYNAILNQIADGQLPSGAWLRESTLSEQMGTSRTPVREALRILAADGLVEVVKNRGARVRTWTNEQIIETYNLRAVLEGYAARQACASSTPAFLERLHDIQRRMEEALETREPQFLDRVAELNAEFHGTIQSMANSPLLSGFVETLSSVSLVRRAFRGYTEQDLDRTVASHRDIILGIETQTPDLAQAAMQSHILAATRSATTALTQPPER